MTQIMGTDAPRTQLTGRVIDRSDFDRDTARSVWNGGIDRRPAVIARCTGPSDVAAAISGRYQWTPAAGGRGAAAVPPSVTSTPPLPDTVSPSPAEQSATPGLVAWLWAAGSVGSSTGRVDRG